MLGNIHPKENLVYPIFPDYVDVDLSESNEYNTNTLCGC